MNIFDRARRLVAQSKPPTTLSEQLSKLAKRRKCYGQTRVATTLERSMVETPVHDWQRSGFTVKKLPDENQTDK